ncbi:hypothetical protein AX14_010861 [Amanita brunnescens Koide BX004]|nr:hypothetical protein AX14_010861 [Amanita brunnescens Koide BX004]
MSTAANSYYFRRRTIGRAASPPTWACYEQIPYDDDDYSDSCSDSCSEDDDDYPSAPADVTHAMDMDEDHLDSEAGRQKPSGEPQKDVKGKQKVADPEPEDRKRNRKKHHKPMYTLRPILTIHKSQGFVWNQDLFVPPYIKDRYVASTSPPNSRGFVSSSALSANSGLPDYEVEVVEIRVKEGDLDGIIP